MFDDYPKTRPPLPKEISAIYSSLYKANREGKTAAASIAQRMEAWMHRQVAADVHQEKESRFATLELGAGTLNQLHYEPSVKHYDIVEPFSGLYQNSPHLDRVRNIYADIAEIPESIRYKRITSIATLEHICNLPEVIARSAIMLDSKGVFRAGIPSEGTLLWTLGWKLTTGLEFRLKHGLDYGLLMKHEHVNSAKEIETLLQHFYQNIQCKVFGLSKALSLYRYYECREPFLDRCTRYLVTPAVKKKLVSSRT